MVSVIKPYNQLIKEIILRLAEMYGTSENDVETEIVFDDEHGHYMLFDLGWDKHQRIQRQFVYVRLKNGKFWIEDDWTQEGIVSHLLAAKVPNDDIVLAFNPPDMRPYTEYAVA